MSVSRSPALNPSGTGTPGKRHGVRGGLRAAGAADLAAIEGLLEASGLPAEGVADSLAHFFVYEDGGGTLLGAAGLELYGAAGLLRSTVVAESARRRGIAAALIERAVEHAQDNGCRCLYLLTLDAYRYFERFGFGTIGREDAPAVIRGSAEFTTLCPASAVLMRRMLET